MLLYCYRRFVVVYAIFNQGPPPDPGYSYLADNRRDGTYKHSEQESTRRHPRNWGGSNFQQVKPLMSQKRMQVGNFIDVFYLFPH